MGTPWKMPLALVGGRTGDGRIIGKASLSHHHLPMPLRAVSEDAGAHTGAFTIGKITHLTYGVDGQPMGGGVFFDDESAPEEIRTRAAQALYLAQQGVSGPSVDLDSSTVEARPRQTLANAAAGASAQACGCGGGHESKPDAVVTKGRIRAATLVPIQAFAELAGQGTFGDEAALQLGATDTEDLADDDLSVEEFASLADAADQFRDMDQAVGGGVDRDKLKSRDFVDPVGRRFPIVTAQDVHDAISSYGRAKPLIPLATFRRRLTAIATRLGFQAALPDSWDEGSMTASAATAVDVPLNPPAAWFDNPQFSQYTPLTITDDGRVFGHLAEWDRCHTGVANACIRPPHSNTNYAFFETGEVVTAEGTRLRAGRLSLGGGHADGEMGFRAAVEHYDSTSTISARVVAGEDSHGIWVAGAMMPGLSPNQWAAARLSPPSGDWRRVGGNLELVAALHVNTAGFPGPRAVLTASGEPLSLVAAGMRPVEVGNAGLPADLAAVVSAAVRELRQQEAGEAVAGALRAERARAAQRVAGAPGRRARYARAMAAGRVALADDE